MENGDFSADFEGWTDAEGSPVNGEVWGIEPGVGPNGENAIKSSGATEGVPFCRSFELEEGTYVATFQIKGTEAGRTSIGTVSNNAVSISGNCADIFINYDGTLAKGVSSAEFPVQNVAAAADFTSEWTTVNFYFEIVDTLETIHPALVMYFERMATDVMITNIAIHNAEEVYDTRITDRLISFAQQVMEDPNFNTSDASSAKSKLQSAITAINTYTDNGRIDQQGASLETALRNAINTYMDATTENLAEDNTYFNYVSDLTGFPKKNRKDIKGEEVVGGFKFHMDGVAAGGETNWLHGSGSDFLAQQIQGTYSNGAGSVALYNSNLPAGKYYVAAEMRVGSVDKNYNYTFSLEKNVRAFIGSNSQDMGVISGADFVKFYYVAEIQEGETFEAGFWWEGHDAGSGFQIKNFECRSFSNVADQVAHQEAWNTFIAQYNAVISARNSVVAKIGDKNYPWEQDSLQRALTQWDPLYNDIINRGWVTSDGQDAGVASTDDLYQWAYYQGGETPEGGVDKSTTTYQLVRGYQYANNEIVSQNKPITDLKAKLEGCRKTDNEALYIECDHETYESVIAQAQAALDDILANTNDDRQESDVQTINDWLTALDEATQIFIDSGKPKPFIDIDFSGGFTAITDPEDPETVVSYVINGKNDNYPNGAGQMQFAVTADVQPDLTQDGHYWQLGFGDVLLDVLHVGSSEAFVEIPAEEIPGDEDIIRTEFDVWFGNLGKGYLTIELRNAADQRLGGFSIDRYNGKVAFNDFNNVTGEPNDHTETSDNGGTGLDLRQYATGQGSSSVGNAGICIDDNKSSFVLEFDYKARALRGSIINGQNGKCEGAEMPMLDINDANITDNKVAKFVITSNYKSANSGAQSRRCWFDNLKIFRYPSNADGPHFEYNVTPGVKGDVNGDEKVNISDVVAIINTMAGDTTFAATADVNGDGEVNISDVVKVINIMAGTDE